MKTPRITRREIPLAGPRVARELLATLRAAQTFNARRENPNIRDTAEIETWENIIRENIDTWRAVPRAVLTLDSETTVALDAVFGGKQNDYTREWRRAFALHAIKAVCQAIINQSEIKRFEDFAVEIRRKSEDEKAIDSLTMQIPLDHERR